MMAPGHDLPAAPRRPSLPVGWVLTLLLTGWLAMLVHAGWARHQDAPRRAVALAVVRALDLTDMAWFTEARYTRHPGLADLHSAFQDGPGALEHFPSGVWVRAPRFAEPARGKDLRSGAEATAGNPR